MSVLKETFKDDIFAGNRKYQVVNNADGTVSFVDVTTYTQSGDLFGANDINAITAEVNKKETFQIPTGTGTAIVLSNVDLATGKSKTFIVKTANNGAATTINGKKLFKPGTGTTPNLKVGKAVTVWYDEAGDGGNGCFFIKASAEGNAIAAHVLAPDTFSNDDDTGLAGTMVDRSLADVAPSSIDGTTTAGRIYVKPLEGYYNPNKSILIDDPDFVPSSFLETINLFGKQGGVAVKTNVGGGIVSPDGFQDGAGTIYLKVPQGYYDGGGNSYAKLNDPDFVAANILNTANLFGLQGAAIPRKFASGNVMSDTVNATYYYTNGTQIGKYSVTVSGLSFTPLIIIIIYNAGTYEYVTLYNSLTNIGASKEFHTYTVTGDATTPQTQNIKADAGVAYVNNGGFKAPINAGGYNHSWMAFG